MESFWLKVQPTFQLPSHQVNVKCPKLQLRSLGGKTLSVQALLCHVFCLQQVGVWLTAWKLQKYCVHHPRQWRLEHPTAACRKESRITTQGECDYPLSNPDCPPLDALRSQEGARSPEKPIVLPEVSNRTEELSTRQGWWFRKYSLPGSLPSCADWGHTADRKSSHIHEKKLQGAKSFRNLSEHKKNKVRQIIFISDKFCIGKAPYHELTMVPGGEGMPRSYLVKQCKNQLNQLCHVSKTPGPAEGAQLDFESELKNRIMQQASNLLLWLNEFKWQFM